MTIQFNNFQIVKIAVNEPMGVDFFSQVHDMRTFDIMAIQAVWVNANGTVINPARVYVEGSLDGANWCDVFPETSVKKIDKVNGCAMYSYDAVAWIYQRVRFEHRGCTSGTLTIYSCGKRRRSDNP